MTVFNKPVEIYVFIRQNGNITGIEILNGKVSVENEFETVPSNDMFVKRELTGKRFIEVKGMMGATESRDGMPDYKPTERKSIGEKRSEK